MVLITGCGPSQPFYFFDDGDMSHYKGVAIQVEYPDTDPDRLAEVEGAQPPLTLRNSEAREIWDLTLQEAIRTALTNGKVIKGIGTQVTPAPTNFCASPTTRPRFTIRPWPNRIPVSVSRRPCRPSMPS